jgi:ribonuclease Z
LFTYVFLVAHDLVFDAAIWWAAPIKKSRRRVMKIFPLLCVVVATSVYGVSIAESDAPNLALGAADTEQNYTNSPFVTPSEITAVTNPSTWPQFQNRAPADRSPTDKSSKLLTMGTGTPTGSAYRFGPAMALIVNDYPYFVDCGEGWWRAVNRSTITQGGIDLTGILTVENAKYMFLTHLHEDHTVGLPSFILSPYKFGSTTDKVIFGPPGTEGMINGIVQGWILDRQEMVQGSIHQSPQGSSATVGEVDFKLGAPGPIYEDDNVKVEAFPTEHGSLAQTMAFRFTTKPDGRVIAFGGDGHYSEGLVQAAKNADILVIEGITRQNIQYATWGGDTVEEKVETISAYHMFPSDMKKVQDESGVNTIVMVHEQNFNSPENFSRLGLRDEMREAGVKNIFSAIDGDLF